MDHGGGQPEVTRVAMRALPVDAIVEGEIMDYGLVADTIRDAFQSSSIKGKDVITAVGGHDVIIKKIEMDRMKETDAREVESGRRPRGCSRSSSRVRCSPTR